MSELFAIPLCKVVNFSLKAKLLKFKSEAGQKWGLFCFTFLFVFLIIGNSATAQVETPIKSLPGKLPVKRDSIRPDTLIRSKKDTVHVKSDTLKNVKKKGAIETTIVYSAQDSINSRLDRKIVMLFGDAKIKYGAIQLEADEIVIDYETSTITGHGGVVSRGKSRGNPIFMNGNGNYETKDIVYNFKTKK